MTIRLLEVSVECIEPTREWRVLHVTDEIVCGYETSLKTAQNVGDSAF